MSSYLEELEAEVTRLRKLCGETTDKLAVLVSHIAEDRRPNMLSIITNLLFAAHGRPFNLDADKKE